MRHLTPKKIPKDQIFYDCINRQYVDPKLSIEFYGDPDNVSFIFKRLSNEYFAFHSSTENHAIHIHTPDYIFDIIMSYENITVEDCALTSEVVDRSLFGSNSISIPYSYGLSADFILTDNTPHGAKLLFDNGWGTIETF